MVSILHSTEIELKSTIVVSAILLYYFEDKKDQNPRYTFAQQNMNMWYLWRHISYHENRSKARVLIGQSLFAICERVNADGS